MLSSKALGATSAGNDAKAVVLSVSEFPGVLAYSWNISGFGGLYSTPTTLPTGSGNGVAFSPDGLSVAVAHASTPFVTAYPWSGGGFGTKFSNPATLPTGNGNGVTFSPDGSAIAVAHDNSPFVTAYPWSGGGFGTKFSNPATLPPSTGYIVAFSPNGLAVAVAHNNSPFITAYPWSGSGFGTKYANPATLPTGAGYSVAFSPDMSDAPEDWQLQGLGAMGSGSVVASKRSFSLSTLTYSAFEQVYAQALWPVDVVLVSLSRDPQGRLYLGASHGAALAAARRARVVLAEVIGVSTFTVALLAVAYPLVRRGSIAWARFTLTSRTHLAGFVALLLVTPVLLILY
jgi:WD40 repeat protein